ncbi:calmodulin, partial [Polychytrium aggregatum]|uniref:calmodulin n=1 Tax=Polychytrium aggregatum TaxID=110093 RepID=UPI0022FF3030
QVFLLFDKDGNGSIDMGELKDAMQSIGVAVSEDEAKRMIGRIDMDKTETVDMPEFCKMVRAGFGGFRTSEELREAFVAMDIGGDGVISPADLIIVMDGLGERMSQEEALEWIKYVDSDADGVVGFEDFAKLMLEDS